MDTLSKPKLNELVKYALSSSDIHAALPDCAIYTYDQLKDIPDIDTLLGKSQECIILYKTGPSFGHWVCVFKKRNVIHFFDSYGIFTDDELHFISKDKRIQLGESYAFLSKLILDSPYQLDYNEKRLQSKASYISTCGKWCIVRLLSKDLSTNQFARTVRKEAKLAHLSTDEYIAALFYQHFRK
jgi:hypothetical protein